MPKYRCTCFILRKHFYQCGIICFPLNLGAVPKWLEGFFFFSLRWTSWELYWLGPGVLSLPILNDKSPICLGADPKVVRGADGLPDDFWCPNAYSQAEYLGPGVPLSIYFLRLRGVDLAESGLCLVFWVFLLLLADAGRIIASDTDTVVLDLLLRRKSILDVAILSWSLIPDMSRGAVPKRAQGELVNRVM